MSSTFLPCGKYHERYGEDHAWWQTGFIKGKMILLALIIFIIIPLVSNDYWLSLFNILGYTILGALGVQLLIGYCGQLTLGHGAFIAMGAYISSIMLVVFPWPRVIHDAGIAYPLSILIACVSSGVWSVLFGLPSARVKGFYLILTTMAAHFITYKFILEQVAVSFTDKGNNFSISYKETKIGPWVIDSVKDVYFLMVIFVIISSLVLANLIRSRVGRAWIAIRDNDISAEVMGINIVKYKLLAFFTAGFIAGLAGVLVVVNAHMFNIEYFEWFLSLWLVGIILIGGVGSIHGVIFGSIFMVIGMEFLQMGVDFLSYDLPAMLQQIGWDALAMKFQGLSNAFNYIRDAFFGLLICLFLIFEPHGMAYRWWQIKNYFNLWPFSY